MVNKRPMTATSLQVSDALKNALCTNLCISEDNLSKIIDSVTDQENYLAGRRRDAIK